MFDMTGAGFAANGYLYATVGGAVRYWPSWSA
jgi:hypothetical protein